MTEPIPKAQQQQQQYEHQALSPVVDQEIHYAAYHAWLLSLNNELRKYRRGASTPERVLGLLAFGVTSLRATAPSEVKLHVIEVNQAVSNHVNIRERVKQRTLRSLQNVLQDPPSLLQSAAARGMMGSKAAGA